MSDELKALLEAMNGVKDGVTSLKDAEKAHAAWRESAEARIAATEAKLAATGVKIPGYKGTKECKEFNLLKAAAGASMRNLKGVAPAEYDVLAEQQKVIAKMSDDDQDRYFGGDREMRTMATNIDTSAGYLVPIEQQAEMIEFQYAATVVIQAGATVAEGLRGSPVTIPTQTGQGAAAEVAENGAGTYTDLTFGQRTMSPRKLFAGIKMSRESALLSVPALQGIATNDLMMQMALTVDIRALRGSGASLQPIGIANQAGINETEIATNGGPVSYDLFVDMEYELAADNAMPPNGRYAYVGHPRTRRNARKLTDGFGRPLFDFDATGDNPFGSVLGHKWLDTTAIPVNLTKASGTDLSEIYFANWRELIIGFWGPMRIESSIEAGDSNSSAFTNDQLWVKTVRLYDVAVRHANSFNLVNDVS